MKAGGVIKATPSKLHMHVKSAAFLCVSKCALNSTVFPNGMGKIYKKVETEQFFFIVEYDLKCVVLHFTS